MSDELNESFVYSVSLQEETFLFLDSIKIKDDKRRYTKLSKETYFLYTMCETGIKSVSI